MTDYFVQTEYNLSAKESRTVKLLLWFSYSLKLSALVCAGLSYYSLYVLIPAAVLFIVGVILRQCVLERTEAYEYFLVKDRLKISKRTNFGVQKLMLDISLSDIKCINENDNLAAENDICAAPIGKSTIKISFCENSITKNLYFAPSEFLLALIREKADI